MSTAEDFLSEAERAEVAMAIAKAERYTSGEIRVHLEDHIEEDVLDHAAFIFIELGMHHTRDRNGVLIYVSVIDRLVAVVGDKGVNEKVPQGFWDDTVALLIRGFAEGRRTESLCEAVHRVARLLAEYFPARTDDNNELTNEVSIGW